MVTTIGIDPHKATHTAVAIDESETVLGEMTVPADRYQTTRLPDGLASSTATEGKTKKEALRALKRRLSDTVYRRLIADQQHAHQ